MIPVDQVISCLNLRPLPVEGGLFRQTYIASETIPVSALPQRYPDSRPFGSAIYYLLTDEPDSFSELHRLPTDEIYHFYLGDPVEMLLLFPEGKGKRILLGQDLLSGQIVQQVVPAGTWQASRVLAGGRYALLGTTMAPAFMLSDYTTSNGTALELQYPDYADLIHELTRTSHAG
jgi:predicted cupin superfamily sugar epimerase